MFASRARGGGRKPWAPPRDSLTGRTERETIVLRIFAILLMKSNPVRLLALPFFAVGLLLSTQVHGVDVRKNDSRDTITTDYVLQPQDSLKVQVYQEDDISRQGEVTISQEFTVFLPLIGTINLKGKTARQAESMIRGLYDKDYLVEPQVSVLVIKYAERSFNVFGAVGGAGRKLIPPERTLTLLDGLSLAGGASRLGDLKKVKLTRNNGEGDPVTVTINVDELMKGTGSTIRDTIYIQPDDIIFVPERII